MTRSHPSRASLTGAATLAMLLLGACASPPVTARTDHDELRVAQYGTAAGDILPAMSIGDIVLQLESGRPEPDIVADVYNRGIGAPASGADLELLRRAGASPALLQAVYEAPVVSQGGGTVIIRPQEYVPWIAEPWPRYPYGYRAWPPPPRPAPPPRPRQPGPPPGFERAQPPDRGYGRPERAPERPTSRAPEPNRHAPPQSAPRIEPQREPQARPPERVQKPLPRAPRDNRNGTDSGW